MAPLTYEYDLASMRLRSGEGRRIELTVPLGEITLGGERYEPDEEAVPARLEVSKMAGEGYALRLSFSATLRGPCMRCLSDASPLVEVDVREVEVAGGGEDLNSPYVNEETLNLSGWARDAFMLCAPSSVLCRRDCRGLCPICAADLNEAGEEHFHEREPDPRWAKLSELKLE